MRLVLAVLTLVAYEAGLEQADNEPRFFSLRGVTFQQESAAFEVRSGPNSELSARPGGAPQFDAIRGMVTNGPGTNNVGQVTGIAGTVRGLVDNHTSGNNGYSVGVFGNATCEVNGCVSWGSNFSVADRGPKGPDVDAANRTIEGTEIDVNVHNSSTVAEGVNVVGNFGNNEVTPTFGYNLQVNGASPAWAQGYSTGNGAASSAFVAGAASSKGSRVPSQPVVFNFFDDIGNQDSVFLRAGMIGSSIMLMIDGRSPGLFASKFIAKLAHPATSSEPCIVGQFEDDVEFHYVCVASNKWRRVALNDF